MTRTRVAFAMNRESQILGAVVTAGIALLAASCAHRVAHQIPAGARIIVPAEHDPAALQALRRAAGEPLSRTGRVVELHRPAWLTFDD